MPSSVLGIGDTKGNKTLFYFIPHIKEVIGGFGEVSRSHPQETGDRCMPRGF